MGISVIPHRTIEDMSGGALLLPPQASYKFSLIFERVADKKVAKKLKNIWKEEEYDGESIKYGDCLRPGSCRRNRF